MRIAIMVIAYNEEETIGAVLKNWREFHRLVLISERPWNGKHISHDRTEEIARKHGAETIRLHWPSEEHQRNWGLAYLYEYDYVLIVDSDELYLQKDKDTILQNLQGEHCYRIPHVITYWKDYDHILDPPDTHEPIVAVNPKKMLFQEARIVVTDWQPVINATMHHLSYAKSDKKMLEKIQTFAHADIMRDSWYTTKWKADATEDVRPYGCLDSKVIDASLPDELRQLL